MKKQAVYIILLLLLTSMVTGSSRNAEPFSTIQWAIGPLTNISQTEINQYWHNASGFTTKMRTPFYFGVAELGVAFNSYDEYESVEYIQVHCYLAFLKEFSIFKKIPTYLGVTVGNSFFHFDSEENQYLQNESELTLGISGGIEIPITQQLSAQITSHYSKIFTFHAIKTTNLGLLFAYKFSTPQWMVTFLK